MTARFGERLRAALIGSQPLRREIPEFASAAVLVPLVERAGVPALVFTRRPQSMSTHGGQVAFPGGRREDSDAGPCATALREAHEELGIEPGTVEVLGELDQEITPFGFVITPVVGWLGAPQAFCPNPREVELCFEVAIERLADPAAFFDHGAREIQGRIYTLPEYRVDDHVIWGATARMVQGLLARIAS